MRVDALPRQRPGSYAAALGALATLVMLGLLAACSPAGEPVPAVRIATALPNSAAPSATSPPTAAKSRAATATAGADPVLARIPPAARSETMDGATAFAKFYIAQVNQGFRSGESKRMRELSGRSCKMCIALADGIDQVGAATHRYSDDLVEVRYASAAEFTKEARRVVVWVNQNPVYVLGSRGQHIRRLPGARLVLVMTLEYRQRWVVARLQKVKS